MPVGRIVFTDQALPAILPVNFSVWDGSVLIRTGAGSKLAAATGNAVVAFEVDEIDQDTGKGWGVVVVGRSGLVDHPEEVAPRTWVGDRDHLIRIAIGSITGRRVSQPM